MVQILGEDGNIIDKTREPRIQEKKLLKMFEMMVLVRLLDEKGMRLQRQGRISFNIPSTGQEATQIGAVAALNKNDWTVPAYREPGIALYRGMPLKDLINHWFCNIEDPQKGRRLPGLFGSKDLRFVNPSAPIGTQIVHAAGIGFASLMRKEKEVNIVFFGDGATSSNDFHSGMNFGGVFKVPTIFFCQNNQWAISVPLSKQTAAESIVDKAVGYGIPGIKIDGNDILAVYKTVKDAAFKARKGEGPTLIEAITYRMGPHTSSDDPTKYRPKDELEKWKRSEPLKRFDEYLQRKGIISEYTRDEIKSRLDEEINDLIDRAESLPPPPVETLFEDVYSDIPPHLSEQLDEVTSIARRKESA